MLEKIMEKLFQRKCNHTYKLYCKDEPSMIHPRSEQKVYFVFKCPKCDKVKKIYNYDVLDLFKQRVSEELFNVIFNNAESSMEDIHNKIWNEVDSDEDICNLVKLNYNSDPFSIFKLNKKLEHITAEDIDNCKIQITGKVARRSLAYSSVKSGTWTLFKSKTKNTFHCYTMYDINAKTDIKRAELRSYYRQKAIDKTEDDIKAEAIDYILDEYDIIVNKEIL